MQNFSDVIDRFGYAEVAALLGKPVGTVSSWRTRNLIPPEFWDALVRAAPDTKAAGLTHELLSRFARERAALRPSKSSPANAAVEAGAAA